MVLLLLTFTSFLRIVGFEQLGNSDNFPTSLLEWRIAQSKVINYSGNPNAHLDLSLLASVGPNLLKFVYIRILISQTYSGISAYTTR